MPVSSIWDAFNSAPVFDCGVEIVEEVNSQLTYVARAASASALASDSVWQVFRVTRVGGTITRQAAGDGSYSYRWDQRTTLFPTPPLLNSLSLALDGINDHVTFGDALTFDHATQFSMSFWVRPNNFSSQRCIYSKSTADVAVNGINVQITTGGNVFTQLRSGGAGPNYTSNLTLTALAWNHIVLTYNGGSNQNGLRVYVNGVVATTPASAALSGTWLYGQPAMLGARNGTAFFSGHMDEVSVFDRVLTASEVSQLYNSGTPSDPRAISACTNYWRLGDGDSLPLALDSKGSLVGSIQGGAVFAGVVP